MLTFEELVAARGQALTRLAFLLTQNAHDAHDVVQTTLVRAYTQWGRVVAADRPEAYVRQMLVNAFVDSRRGAHREQPTTPQDAVLDRVVDDDLVDRLVARTPMWRALATLPRQQRAVLVLRYYEALSDDEIALVLDVAAGTVRTHAARGLAALRQQLAPASGPTDETTRTGGAR